MACGTGQHQPPSSRLALWRRPLPPPLLSVGPQAEQLCDRVGIIVNGHLHTIGSPARMKSEVGAWRHTTWHRCDPAGDSPLTLLHCTLPQATF